MYWKTRHFIAILLVGIMSTASVAAAQRETERAPAPAGAPCPNPITVTMDASPSYVDPSDFSQASLAAQVGLNYQYTNKHFLHTFRWDAPSSCCEITSARLIVKMRANQGGSSPTTSSDAGNDNIQLATNGGQSVLPHSERVYLGLGPFQAGQLVQKDWVLSPAVLASMNQTHRLSFLVQDDTQVQEAKLQLSGCCLSR